MTAARSWCWSTSTGGSVPHRRPLVLLSRRRHGPGGARAVSGGGGLGAGAGLVFRPDPAEFAALAKEHAIVGVVQVVADTLTPVACFANVVGDGDGFLFESVEGGERWGRYSFVGRRPLATLTARGRHVEATGRLGLGASDDGILAAVEALVTRFQSPVLGGLPPLHGGVVGYLGYDVVREVERLPEPPTDDLGQPDAALVVIGQFCAFDHWRQRIVLVDNVVVPDAPDGVMSSSARSSCSSSRRSTTGASSTWRRPRTCSILALIAVKSPLGSNALGSQRWFSFHGIQVQPSEFTVLAMILAIAHVLRATPRRAVHARRRPAADQRPACRSSRLPPARPRHRDHRRGDRPSMPAIAGALEVLGDPRHRRRGGSRPFAIFLGVLQHYQIVGGAAQASFSGDDATYARWAKSNAAEAITFGRGDKFGKEASSTGISDQSAGSCPSPHTDFIFTAVGEQLGFVGIGGRVGVARRHRLAGSARCLVVARRHLRPPDLRTRLFAFMRVQRSKFQNAGMTMGDHADHSGSRLPVCQLRRDGGAGLLRRGRVCFERRGAPETPVTDIQPEADAAEPASPDPVPAADPQPSFPTFRAHGRRGRLARAPLPDTPRLTLGESGRPPWRQIVFPVGSAGRLWPWAQALRRLRGRRPMTHELFMDVLQAPTSRSCPCASGPANARTGICWPSST